MAGLALALSALTIGGTATAETQKVRHAKAKPAATAQSKPDCPRANYPGDPVCAWDDDGQNLPTPSARAVRPPATMMRPSAVLRAALGVNASVPMGVNETPL